jgi:tetratricopeptide (TPR) repeat protein
MPGGDMGKNRTAAGSFPDTRGPPPHLDRVHGSAVRPFTPEGDLVVKSRFTVLLLSALGLVACTGEPQGAGRFSLGEAPAGAAPGLRPDLQLQIDSGNAAYREQDYAAALRYYQQAAQRDPTEPTAWFGVSMAAGALGNQELLDSAQLRLHRLAPELTTAGH